MKKLICSVLAVIIALLALGCTPGEQSGGVTFYYLRQSDAYIYQDAEGVLTGEQRKISNSASDLQYLLSLYLEGPVSEGLVSPFPKGTQVVDISVEENTLAITLSGEFTTLADIQQTLACACLCKTCFALTGAETITLLCDQLEMSWTRDSFTLTDGSIHPAG